MKNNKVTVIVPTKNEAGGIRQVIRQIKPYADEILVIDGHSTDKTVDIVKKMGIRVIMDQRKGVGAAKRQAISKSSNDIIVLIDADGSHNAKDIPRLVKPIKQNKTDLVIASRIKGGSDEFNINLSGLIRQAGGDFVGAVINSRFKVTLTDTLCGYRAIRKSVVSKLNLNANDFDIEHEMIIKCLKKGFRVSEISSHEYARGWGVAKLPTFRKGWLFIWRLFREII